MRALGLIVCLLTSAVSHALPSVALDLTELDAESFAALDGVAFEKSATVRLVQDGFAVVARTASPDVLVRVEVRPTPRVLVLTGHGPGGDASAEIPWESEPLFELHLELVQKLVEVTRATAHAKEVVVAPVIPAPSPVPEPPEPHHWHVMLVGSGLFRDGGVDPLGLVAARWGVRYRIALELGFSGSGTSSLRVFEGQLSAGAALAVPLTKSVELELAALVGGLMHHFSLADRTTAVAEGTRFNMLFTVPVSLSLALNDAVRLGLRLAAGWGQAREHLDGEQPLWTRGPLRFEFGVNAAWSL